MYFYLFSTLFTSDFAGFSVSSASSVVFSLSPIQELEPGPRLAVVGGVLPLSSRTAAAVNKNT